MTLETTRDIKDLTAITRATDAREVAHAAYERLLGLLRTLEPDDWQRPTECPGWSVADLVGHLIGAAKAGASLRENLRQQWWGRRHGARYGNTLDGANQRQILDHAALTPVQRITELERVVTPAVAGRMRAPGLVRRVRVPIEAGGSTAAGMPSSLQLGHLLDVVYTRDVWLHTIDIARATGRPYRPDAAVDQRLVEDVVLEWAGRHQTPVLLELTGPAGGRFRQGQAGDRLRLDAVTLCRVLSGRAEPTDADLDVAAEPTSATDLLRWRILF